MRIHLPENTLRIIADAISSHITVRTYVNGNSKDVTFDSTSEDRSRLFPVAFGALLGLNYGDENRNTPGHARAILNASEFILMESLPLVNTYDTIYNPLKAVLDVWCFASVPDASGPSDWAARSVWNLFPAWRDYLGELPAEYRYMKSMEDAEKYLEELKSIDGLPSIPYPLPVPDAGLLFLLWNLFCCEQKQKYERK